MIHTDIFLEIGSQHKVCEDYIIKGSEPEPFIILSDGCSSSMNTDMGSRILCYLAKQYLRYRVDSLYNIDYHKMGRWIIHNAEMTARQLGLNISCLDATLIIAFYLDYQVQVFMYGDGCILTKKGDLIQKKMIEYTRNAPYYLSYLVDDDRHDQYHDLQVEKHLIESGISGDIKQLQAYDYESHFRFNTTDYDAIWITSDGMESFIAGANPIQMEDLLPDFMTFKNVKGEFLKRRLNKAMKTLNKNGITHYDDLSAGAFINI